ncbi:MAG: hypothetical protein KF712_16565 [Akkermansiaceae bacterium]|nr:hypothetical protein [Akkermansiaceae bacterium]
MSLPSARPIAFNRRLRASWLEEGLRLRSDGLDGPVWVERMEELIKVDISGKDSIAKSMRYLRHVWADSGEDEAMRSEAIAIFRSSPTSETAIILSWGMVIATYPFLNDVAATVGRMIRVQPEVKLEQILRKLSETYGERETVRRSGRYALGLITDFGFVKRASSPGCYVLGNPIKIDPTLSGWFVRSWFKALGSTGVIDRVGMAGAPSLVFFDSASLISDAIERRILVPERLSFSQEVLRLN